MYMDRILQKHKKEQTRFNNIINKYDILSQGHIEEEIYLKRKECENIREEKEKGIHEEKEEQQRRRTIILPHRIRE